MNYVYLNLVFIILMVVVITMCWLHYSDGGIHVQSPMRIMIMSIMQMLELFAHRILNCQGYAFINSSESATKTQGLWNVTIWGSPCKPDDEV